MGIAPGIDGAPDPWLPGSGLAERARDDQFTAFVHPKGRRSVRMLRAWACGIAAAVQLMLVSGASAASSASGPSPEQRYRTCMQQVETDPSAALTAAKSWQSKGGGAPASHCLAAAQIATGRFAEAAAGLEALARETTSGSKVLRASLWGQAAHAWLSADEPARAATAAGEGLSLVPDDPRLLVLRARGLAGDGHFAEAIGDLDRAIAERPDDADALVFRASALRRENAIDRARADLDRALALDPRHPEGLLERGIIRRITGDDAGARSDWEALVAAAPKSAAAEQARLNLERMQNGT
jgi:tetratricopeptide (TPR) repeat protein